MIKRAIRENTEGLSRLELAAKYEVTYDTIRYYNPKNLPVNRPHKLTTTQEQEVRENVDGLTTVQLAEHYEVSRNTISKLHPVNRPTIRVVTPEIIKAIEANAEGLTTIELAKKYGVSCITVNAHLIEFPKNIKYRIKHEPHPIRLQAITEWNAEKCNWSYSGLIGEVYSAVEFSEQFKISQKKALVLLREIGEKDEK